MDASIKIPCTFFSTKEHDLLLPNSAITEVILKQPLEQMPATTPQWIAGQLKWQTHLIFIINFDKLEANTKSAENDRFIIVIRNPLYIEIESESNIEFFGISIHHTPHVIEANSHNLDKNLQPKVTHSHAASYATINNKHVIIPSIDSIITSIKKSATITNGKLS